MGSDVQCILGPPEKALVHKTFLQPVSEASAGEASGCTPSVVCSGSFDGRSDLTRDTFCRSKRDSPSIPSDRAPALLDRELPSSTGRLAQTSAKGLTFHHFHRCGVERTFLCNVVTDQSFQLPVTVNCCHVQSCELF